MITPFSRWYDFQDLHFQDLQILDAKGYASGRPDQNVIVTSDGDILATVPKSWTEEDIKIALRLANEAYIWGFKVGERNVKNQFKLLMDINSL